MILQTPNIGAVRTFDFSGSNVHCKISYPYQPFYTNVYAYKCLSVGDYIDLEQVVTDFPEIVDVTREHPFELLKGFYIIAFTQDNTNTTFSFLINEKTVLVSDTGEVNRDGVYYEQIFSVSYPNNHLPFPLGGWLFMIHNYRSMQITDDLSFVDSPLLRFEFPYGSPTQIGGTAMIVALTYSNRNGVVEINDRTLPIQSTDDPSTWYGLSKIGSTKINSAMFDWQGLIIEDNQEGDHSGEGGGGGNYGDETTDEVPHDGVPTISTVSSGFVKLYHPSVASLLSFRDFLYSSSFLDNVKKLLNNPLDYVIALMLNATTPTDGSAEQIGAGGLASNVTAPVISSQYKVFDCGGVNIEECYGGFLDYDNLTQVRVYLPFCGEITLDTNVVMHSTIYLRYAVDYLTGNCLARIAVYNNHGTNAEFYFKEGNCACQIPMSGANYASFFTQGFRALMGVGSAIGGNVGGGLAQTADAVASMHVERQRVGSISGEHGMLGNYTPYVIIERPAQSFPNGNNRLLGRPSNVGGKVSSFTGYTEIDYIKLDGIKATDSELEEIKQLLADGVYI